MFLEVLESNLILGQYNDCSSHRRQVSRPLSFANDLTFPFRVWGTLNLAEFSFISCPEENDSGQTQVSTKDDPGCENFIEFPAAGTWQRLHSFFRYHHDGTCRAIAVNAKTSDTSHLAHKPEHSRQEQEYRNSPSLTIAITRTTKGWEFKFLEKRKQHKPELRRY